MPNIKTNIFYAIDNGRNIFKFDAKANLDSGLIKDERNPLMWILPSSKFKVHVKIVDFDRFDIEGEYYLAFHG